MSSSIRFLPGRIHCSPRIPIPNEARARIGGHEKLQRKLNVLNPWERGEGERKERIKMSLPKLNSADMQTGGGLFPTSNYWTDIASISELMGSSKLRFVFSREKSSSRS